MESTRSWLDNLKIRASYGTLGNQYTSSLYPYMALIQPSTSNMPIGGEITSSMQQSEASNNILSWESIKMTNIGLDVNLLNNRLSLTADYFIKNTDDILLKVKLPDVLGVSEPYQNAGKVQNKGWEIALAWQDKIGKDFTYGVNVTFSDVKNKVVSVGNTADDFSAIAFVRWAILSMHFGDTNPMGFIRSMILIMTLPRTLIRRKRRHLL